MKNHIRKFGWLAVAGLLGAALIAPTTTMAAGIQDECAGYTYWFKIDNIADSGIVADTYEDGDSDVETNWPGQVITISNVTNGGQNFDWASTKTVLAVFVKEGNTLVPAAGGTSGSIVSTIEEGGGLSHVTFCGNAETTTTTTTTTTSAVTTTQPVTTTTTSAVTTTTTTPSVDTVTTTTTSKGTEAVKTPPQTDTIAQGSPSSVSSALLIVFAGLLALALLVPVKARSRR